MGRPVFYIAVIAALAGVPSVAQADHSNSDGQSLVTRLGDAFFPGIPKSSDEAPTMSFAEPPSAYARSEAFDRLYGAEGGGPSRQRPARLAPERAAPNLFHLRF